MTIKTIKMTYDAPRVNIIKISEPMSLLTTLSYPGEIDGEFDDLINHPDWIDG